MKKAQHISMLACVSAGVMACLLMALPQAGFSQNSWDQDNYQQQYRTSNTGTGEWVNWEDEKWEVWEGNDQTGSWVPLEGHPPYNSDENSTYIEIQAGDSIRLDSTLAYKNNLTLRVCGVLDIATLSLQDMVPSVVLDQEDISVDQDNLTVSVTAEYFSETEVEGHLLGFYLAPVEVTDPVDEAYLLPASSASHFTEPDHYHGTFTIGPLEALADGTAFIAGQRYQLVAYAENSTGFGYSVVREFQFDEATSTPPSEDASKENEPVPEEDEVNAFNRIRLWICEGGKLTIGAIKSKNNALLHIDGALIVEEFIFDTNNYCITGNGSISTSTGQAPPITGSPANKCKGFDGVLPIELLHFSATTKPDCVELTWSTASETNNDYFTLERSHDLYSWETIGIVEGAGNSHQTLTYHLKDVVPMQGQAYYRLKQTDFDGAFEVFEPIAVNYQPGIDGLDFTVTKSPGQWTINLPGQESWQVEIYTPGGRQLVSATATGLLSIPAPDRAVVIRIFNGTSLPVSRIVL